MRVSQQGQAYLYAILAVLFWSTVATAFKLTLGALDRDVFQMLFYSTLTSTICLLLIVVLQGKLHLVISGSPREYAYSALLGLLQPSLYYAILFKAYALLPAQQAQPLNMTWPIVVVLLSIPLLKQRVRLSDLAALAVCFCGVLVICLSRAAGDANPDERFGHRFSDPFGVALALSSSVIWALFWLCNVRDKRDTEVKLLLGFSFASVFTALFVLFFSSFRVPMAGLLGSAYAGVFEMGLTYVVWLKALTLSRTTSQVSILVYLMPFLSLIVIHFVLGEHVRPATVFGLVLIVAGILIQQWATGGKEKREA